MAAMSMSAQVTMTCDEAYNAAIALNAGDTLTDAAGVVQIVEVTAYVTNGGNGTVDDKNQQTFYIGATKDETTKTIQCYRCGITAGEAAVNKGDKVKVTGKLMHYVNSSGTTDVAELVYATAEVLDRVTVKTDTINDLTVCEIIEEGESLNKGTYSQDFFEITATVDSLTYTSEPNMQQTFFFKCDNGKTLQAYNAAMQDGVLAAVGDTVKVLGKITNYQNKQIEFEEPKAWVVGKAKQAEAQKVSVSEAVKIGQKLAQGAIDQKNTYVVEGYIAEIAVEYSEEYKNLSFYMTDDENGEERYFEVFRGSYPTNELKVGDKVFVIGQLQHYYKAATYEEDGTTVKTEEIDIVEMINGKVSLTDPTTAVENIVSNAVKAVKVVENGQIFILKDGVRYNILGAQVK